PSGAARREAPCCPGPAVPLRRTGGRGMRGGRWGCGIGGSSWWFSNGRRPGPSLTGRATAGKALNGYVSHVTESTLYPIRRVADSPARGPGGNCDFRTECPEVLSRGWGWSAKYRIILTPLSVPEPERRCRTFQHVPESPARLLHSSRFR